MSDRNSLNPEEQALENRLRRLVPGQPRLQRDALMFQAGQRIARRQMRAWQAAASMLLLGMILAGWPASVKQRVESTPILTKALPLPLPAARPRPQEIILASGVTTRPGMAADYLRMRYQLVMEGVDSLPAPRADYVTPETVETIADWYRAVAPVRKSSIHSPVLNLNQHRDRS